MGRRVLIIDDDPGIRKLVRAILSHEGIEVEGAATCQEALKRAERGFDGVVLLDAKLPDGDGADLFPKLSWLIPAAPVIMLTAHSTADFALEMLQSGVYDFLSKRRLRQSVTRSVQGAFDVLEGQQDLMNAFGDIITQSNSMRAAFQSLMPAMSATVPVLIQGESGTGKELVARALHEGSSRKGSFVGVNCAGIPEQLLEAELFGYEKGAFTGASGRKLGRFDLAQGGTLLLDEIGEMDMILQAKLLRVLQESEYQRLGGIETIQSDVRIISATHRRIEGRTQSEFRQDLFYRLALFTVELPPLRDRHGDVPLLANHFVKKHSGREGRAVGEVDELAMELLNSYSFPGNVRQLENVIAHAVLCAKGDRVHIADLPKSFLRTVAEERKANAPKPAPEATPQLPSQEQEFLTLSQLEGLQIVKAIERTENNKAEAARILGCSRMTLYRKLKEHGLQDKVRRR